MKSLSEIAILEDEYSESGEKTLGDAARELRQRWSSGSRDRETALRLLFLSWFSLSEPGWLTGLSEEEHSKELQNQLIDFLGGMGSADRGFCFSLGYMASLFPWIFGDEEDWQKKSQVLLKRASSKDSLNHLFDGAKGAYGAYFIQIDADQWLAEFPIGA